MPRNNDPSILKLGAGQKSAEGPNPSLSGIGAVPHVGSLSTPAGFLAGSGGFYGTSAHVSSTKAHAASSISIDGVPPFYFSGNVDGALDELGALVPPKPPTTGNFLEYIGVSGIPDWGILKLVDGPLTDRDSGSMDITTNTPDQIYPYYFYPPHPAQNNPPFEPLGSIGDLSDTGGLDPVTDPTFNVADGGYPGGGPGYTHAGAFTRNVGGPNPITQTMRVMDYDGGGNRQVIVSGIVFPADRGVLALLHYPAAGAVADFLAQGLDTRVVAAILLGNGCATASTSCDGSPGGIFGVGSTSGAYDPYAFPGQATGQFDLAEIHNGVYGTHVGAPYTGTALPAPWDDLDGDTVAGAPAAGQVRLGTDPNAGEAVLANGIPILGGTTAARGGGDDNNFFRYRLPYFDDYSDATGLKYTPSIQKPRYFKKPTVALNAGVDLTQAGDYLDFGKDYWIFQVSRFRHAFTMGAGASPRENGSYMLVHFKKEVYFEEFVRDGIVPTDDKLWSANLVDWTDPELPANLASGVAINGTASGYHNLRAAIIEDDNGANVPIATASTFDYTRTLDEVMWVSGVAYFLPQTAAGADNFRITDFDVNLDNLFLDTFRTFDDQTVILSNPNPTFLYMGAFSYSTDNPGYITVPGGLVTNAGQVRKQRVEFQFQDLGAYTTANGPLPADTAQVAFTGGPEITFAGDTNTPAFSTDATMRYFVRRPVGHQTVADYQTSSLGSIVVPADSKSILFHSVFFNTGGSPVYGNFTDGFGDALPSLETATKDVRECFLDEVYRYRADWVGITAALGANTYDSLIGPGLPHGAIAIDIPVRAGATASAGYQDASWLQRGDHLVTIPAGEAQVSGCPDRNPPLAEGVMVPFPSSGIVRYPDVDYTTNYRPSNGDGDITGTQFDYSALTGVREYVRAFDADFSRTASIGANGDPFVKLKITGLKLEDFEYTAPGPGKEVAILLKVPGLTTWMDIGRQDGSGPGKQDPVLDGAGCQLAGVDTFDDIDTTTGLNYCQVLCHVGPAANLVLNSLNEVPILVKVQFKDTAAARFLDLEYDFVALGDDVDAKSRNVRGITCIEVIP